MGAATENEPWKRLKASFYGRFSVCERNFRFMGLCFVYRKGRIEIAKKLPCTKNHKRKEI